jgi:hypothetical protein
MLTRGCRVGRHVNGRTPSLYDRYGSLAAVDGPHGYVRLSRIVKILISHSESISRALSTVTGHASLLEIGRPVVDDLW